MEGRMEISRCISKHKNIGFTLFEVLVALMIIAISFTAILKASSQNIAQRIRVQDKIISQWVATQGIKLVQLGLVKASRQFSTTKVTTIFNQRWYWRVQYNPSPIPMVRQITLIISHNQDGPFIEQFIGYCSS